jgi:hypothetical protein
MQPPDHISITMFEIQAVDSKYQWYIWPFLSHLSIS